MRAVPNRFRRLRACAEKQGPKMERHGAGRPNDLGCDAGDRASNIARGLGSVEGWRNIVRSAVQHRQSGVRHIRGRRRAHEKSGIAGGHRRRCSHIRARAPVQLFDYCSGELNRCNVCLSLFAHSARRQPDYVRYRWFPGWDLCLVRDVVVCPNLESILRFVDFFSCHRRPIGLCRRSRICPPSSQAAVSAGRSPASAELLSRKASRLRRSVQQFEHE